MKKKQGLLVMLLGCLVTVSAVAGIIVWQGAGKKDEESRQYVESDGSSEKLLWNDEETTGTKEETETKTQETEEAQARGETGAKREAEGPSQGSGVTEIKLHGEAGTDAEEPGGENETETAGREAAAGGVHAVSFDAADKLIWPVEGNIVLDYSMDRTVYFPTLDLYKCNPAVLIQGEAGTPVKAAADGVVKAVGENEELGNYVTMDLGNGYELTYGQLSEETPEPGDFVEAGAYVGSLAEPTKYYVVEGTNLYFQMTKDGEPVDPVDFME